MRILIFGATGMVGQGVMRECLLDPGVGEVVTIGRSATGQSHARLREIVHADLTDYAAIEPQLTGFDACFFCLGIASAGMSEADYRRITYDITLAAARTLVRLNPTMVFVYVSGASTDSSEKGRWMWARVKGATENAIMRLPFRASYMFRPGAIQPLHGIRSKTRLYRVIYDLTAPLLPLLQRWLPDSITTTEQIGKAMLKVARDGAPKPILENADINRL
ncbi:NAD dependent epimerase/dehydratase family protein [Bosea sp. OK403]|uniref:NAD-dependent epimerase/dehydratase family protein n=1 Tax=Bosea sp. OK403 TaxID=1855286 RepID=UPI0008F1C523|nr:NAD-dependent epimerase/dehydratase family protein [Bosea sp. OK403]SFJ65387.1 NAD dependent epimerase/dehydratase family protein [Bosea sp. OK403]